MRPCFCRVLQLSAVLAGVIPALASAAGPDYEELRRRMVRETIAAEGIDHPRVLEAMQRVPRHLFVPENLRPHAYFDQALPIGHQQTISPPFIVAYMTQVLDPQAEDRVLEIGTGSGYQAAVLAELVREVYTIEIVEPLATEAQSRLRNLGYKNIHVRAGDGFEGWPEQAPFDRIIVTCSPESVPQPLVDQLREGGQMVIPLGERYQQSFYLLEKRNGKLEQTQLVPTLFVPMLGLSEKRRLVLPDPLRPSVHNGSFEEECSVKGRAAGWHYQRQMRLVTGGAPYGETYALFENTDAGRNAQTLQAMAIKGSRIGALRISLWVRGREIRSGKEPWEHAALVLHFFDQERKSLGTEYLGPWRGTFDWDYVSKEVAVPEQAQEVMLHIGLNGATGSLGVDDVSLAPLPRE